MAAPAEDGTVLAAGWTRDQSEPLACTDAAASGDALMFVGPRLRLTDVPAVCQLSGEAIDCNDLRVLTWHTTLGGAPASAPSGLPQSGRRCSSRTLAPARSRARPATPEFEQINCAHET